MTAVFSARNNFVPSASAAGILSYLEEDDVSLKVRALEKLSRVLDVHWAEICESLTLIEELSEDTSFPAASLAASIASRCFYHLQEYDDALRLALAAGPAYFDVHEKSEYVEMLLTQAIDQYKALRSVAAPPSSSAGSAAVQPQQTAMDVEGEGETASAISPALEAVIEAMFERCYVDQCFEQAIGIALDTHRLDKVRETIQRAVAAQRESVLAYVFSLCTHTHTHTVSPRDFRLAVIEVVVRAYEALAMPDYSAVVHGLQFLNRPAESAKVLDTLLKGSERDALLAFQIAFDLCASENQGFVLRVCEALSSAFSHAAVSQSSAGASASAADTHTETHTTEESTHTARYTQLRRILLQGLDTELSLHFLYTHNHTDPHTMLSLTQTLTQTCPQGASTKGYSVLHNAVIQSHAFLQAGTTRDVWLRENLDFLAKSRHWAKYTAVASLGVVHRGHAAQALTLLDPYLPKGGAGGVSASPYSEAGALYALGLIFANKGGAGDSATIRYLSDCLANAGTNEILQHGACMGIGLAAMATGDESLCEALRNALFASDSAVAGEGAALGIGLLLLGQSDSVYTQSVLPELLNTMRDSVHDKVTRALSLAVAMTVYGKEDAADTLIETLSRDRDPLVRYGGACAVALAFLGTSHNASIQRLLHVAVSDVSDDVRRMAVCALGFVLCGAEESVVCGTVKLLAESFNAHVRYGACLAVGIACAGTAHKDALDLLFTLTEDSTDFVRQGALLALSMVLQQTSEARTPAVKRFRELCARVMGDKHQSVLVRAGAIQSVGIMSAGGGNVVISLQSKGPAGGGGFTRMGAAVGSLLFIQHWFWSPLTPMLSLAFTPTMMCGLNKDFDMPTDFSLTCNAPPSLFAYAKSTEKKEDEKAVVTHAVLSTTVRHRAREMRREKHKTDKLQRQSSVDSQPPAGEALESIPLERVASHLSTTSFVSVDTEKPTEAKAKKVKEPSSFSLTNPCRLTQAQTRFLSLSTESRYTPVRAGGAVFGIVLLQDNDPSQPETVSKVNMAMLGLEEDAPAPEPFEWDPNDE